MLEHQIDRWEEGPLKGRLSAVREGYEAQIPMATFAEMPMQEKGGRDTGARQSKKEKAKASK